MSEVDPTCAETRALSQYKDRLTRYRDFHYEDNTVASYLHNGDSYIGKTTSLY